MESEEKKPLVRKRINGFQVNTGRGCHCVYHDGGSFLSPRQSSNKYNFWSKFYKHLETWYECDICGSISYYVCETLLKSE